jgi:diguanylate cyclase (GGDEF)-like protein
VSITSRLAGAVAATSPRPGRRLRLRYVFVTGLLVASLLALGTSWLILDLRARAIANARTSLASFSFVVADQADHALQALEQVQIGLIGEMRAAGVTTEQQYISRMATYDVYRAAHDRVSALPQANAVTMIDNKGNLINFSRFWPIPKVNIADRDYFKALSTDASLTRFISMPVRNRGDGAWTVYIARPFRAPDGSFLGLVLGAVELPYFETLYQRIAPGPDAVISLFRTDGVRLVRMPPYDQAIGQVADRSAVMHTLRLGLQQDSIRNIGPIDGKDRLVSVRVLPHFPVAVLVSRTMQALLARWQELACYLGGGALLIEAGLLFVGFLLVRQVSNERVLRRFEIAKNEAEAARGAAEAELTLAHLREGGERALREQYARFAQALDTMKQGLAMFDANDRLIVANRKCAGMFGGGPLHPGIPLAAMLRGARQPGGLSFTDTMFVRRLLRKLCRDWVSASRTWDTADARCIAVNFEPTPDGGWLLTFEDVTERRAAEARIAYLAHYDPLTDLPNRTLFQQGLEDAIAETRNGNRYAVLYLDLDKFKGVNDTLGHSIGDGLLRLVAMRIQRCLRDTDMVARLGGDEFAIVQSALRSPLDAAGLATRLGEEFELPFEIDGHLVTTGVSIGIALAPDDSTDAEQLLKQADLALYQAKSDGRGRYRFFEPEMDRIVWERRRLELELREALSAGQLEVQYQPLIQVDDRRVAGFEALLRWHHPERGLVAPASFIPLAEELGLIVPIGAWVIEQACQEAMKWPAHLKVAVNLSPIQVLSPALLNIVATALQTSGLAPARLELEITETVMLQDTEDTLRILHRLRSLGVAIAMDDFGTGYSSLSYLRRFPFDKVKIDRSFVEGLGGDPDCINIVRAMVGLCRGLNIVTLAEGVETEQQMALLQHEHCCEVQGYLFGRATPSDGIPALLAALES